jgi:hypothetical protein
MPRLPNLRDIRDRKQLLAVKIAGMESDLEKLRDELRDYEAAERVWLTLSGGSEDDRDFVEETFDDLSEAAKAASKRKPTGVPQMPDMIIEAINDALGQGTPGIDPATMLQYVQRKYWPEAKSPDVASTAWRMWKAGRLAKPHKDSPIYTLPKASENAD